MKYEIARASSEEDLAEIARLDKILDSEMEKYLPAFFDIGTVTRDYSGIADESRGFALLARADGRVVGMARAVCGNVVMLESLIVEEGYRAMGIGSALLKDAQALARQRGLSIMMLNVLRGNDGAKRLYEGAGFSDFRTTMVFEL